VPPARSIDAEAKVAALAINPGAAEFAASLKNGKVQIFSDAGQALRSFSPETRASVLAYTAGGRRIVAGCGKSIALFDAAGGARVASWAAAERDDVGSVACSRDGSLIATAAGYEPAKLWKGDGTAPRTLESGPEVLGVAVSPGGDRVAEGSSDTKVRIYSASGTLQRALEFSMACPVLAFSPDGRLLAAGCVDGTVSLFDSASGESRGVLGRHSLPVGAAAFSPDGKRLATTSVSLNPWGADADWKLWDLSSKKETTTPMGPSLVNAVGFPSARPLVLSARDKSISVWD
jgi:WD40 repeat protein